MRIQILTVIHLFTIASLISCKRDGDTNPQALDKLEPTEVAESPKAEKTIDQPAAQWMSGKWGIGWRIKGGGDKWSKKLNVKHLVEQVKTIPGMFYVLFNLSNGADGSKYTAPHSVLSKVDSGSCSERDLFGEMATAFQAEGYKVLVYMATEGPAKLKHGPNHGRGPKSVENSHPDYEDYTFGHPTPLRRVPANSKNNLSMVTSIEDTENGFCMKDGKASLGHLFMPMKNRWNSGADVVWPEEQAVDWMQRVLTAGGAWTWNVPYNDRTSELDPEAVDFAKRVGAQLR